MLSISWHGGCLLFVCLFGGFFGAFFVVVVWLFFDFVFVFPRDLNS